MNVVAALVLDPSTAPGDFRSETIIDLLHDRLPHCPPLRRRLLEVPLGLDHPVWVDDPETRIEDHVCRVRAPAPGGEREFEAIVAERAGRRLDRSRPMWELTVIEGLAGGRLGLVMVLHHSISDGVSGAALMAQLLDLGPQPSRSEARLEGWEPDGTPSSAELLGGALAELVLRPRRIAGVLAGAGRSVFELLRGTVAADTLRGPALPFTAARTRFSGPISSEREVAFSRARRTDLELLRKAFGGTLNDVVLAACTGGLRHYLAERRELPNGPLIATVPVSVRDVGETTTWGNRLSVLFVRLPVHLEDPVERFGILQAETRQAKRLHAAIGGQTLARLAAFSSSSVFDLLGWLYRGLGMRERPVHSAIVSNVPGPPVPLYAGGARVHAAHPLGPLVAEARLNVTVMSYADSVDFGLIACRENVPEAHRIAAGFATSIAELLEIAMKEGWEDGWPEQRTA